MSNLAKKKHKPEQELAISLGWPQESVGLRGAASGLLDLGAPYRRLGSMVTRVSERDRLAQRRVRIVMIDSVAKRMRNH